MRSHGKQEVDLAGALESIVGLLPARHCASGEALTMAQRSKCQYGEACGFSPAWLWTFCLLPPSPTTCSCPLVSIHVRLGVEVTQSVGTGPLILSPIPGVTRPYPAPQDWLRPLCNAASFPDPRSSGCHWPNPTEVLDALKAVPHGRRVLRCPQESISWRLLCPGRK